MPKYDVIFQALFGRPGSEDILSGLLNSLLECEVTNISLKENQILTREYPEDKLGILDLIADINDKETVNIEIQLQNQYNMQKRLLFYWARIYSKKINSGEDYKKLNKTISIMFTDFEISELEKFKDAHTKWTMKEERNFNITFFTDIELHIVEMPKIFRYSETNEKLKDWIQFILNPESEEVRMSIKRNEVLNKAYEKLEEISSDEHLRRIEELKLKKIWDDNSARSYWNDLKKSLFEDGKTLEDDKIMLQERRKELDNDIRIMEEKRRAFERHKNELEDDERIMEEKQRALEKHKNELEDDERIMEEKQRALEKHKNELEDDKKIMEEEQRILEEKKKVLEREKEILKEQEKDLEKQKKALEKLKKL